MRSMLFSIALLSLFTGVARAQIQIGTVSGTVSDPQDAVLSGVRAVLGHAIHDSTRVTVTNDLGEFVFHNVPFGTYMLHLEAPGFQPVVRRIVVRSNIPVELQVRLSIPGLVDSVTVEAEGSSLKESSSSSSATEVTTGLIRRAPGASRSRQLQKLIATTPGWLTENNGLLHVRGVDDGILYVVDGIPITDRLDAVSAASLDTNMIESFTVLTGNVPAEFGGRSGAVVTVLPRSGIDSPFRGTLGAGAGSFNEGEVHHTLGGRVRDRFGFFAAASAARSSRFLDPVDPRNFNNRGGSAKFHLRADWHPTSKDIVLLNGTANGTDFRVPNDLVQELAGQRQRQELRDDGQSIAWQHAWSSAAVTNVAWFRRSIRSALRGSEFDVPLFSEQDRRQDRQGVIASLTRFHRGHTIKTGIEASRAAVREFFTFAVTDDQEAEEREVSEQAQEFDLDDPFLFRDRRAGGWLSWYLQDEFSPVRNLTVSAGLRYDRSTLPGTTDQFSPRIGAVYYVAATNTAIRGSYNRLFMPPQLENLLLAGSVEARRLSPFVDDPSGGGAIILPERVSAWEAGFAQDLFGVVRLDAAYWWRNFRDVSDPNVFFNTTIIFQNNVARGFSRGLDVRLDIPERRGWTGYFSYTNSRILQTGPINGGLFLTEEFMEIGPGVRFIPDQDQRNVGSFGITYNNRATGLWASLSGRHESGVPLEVEEDRIDSLRTRPGAELVDFSRQRVRPWTTFDLSAGTELFSDDRVTVRAQMDIQNIANRPFAYNFGNPFEGTHFGHPRLWSFRLEFGFR